jgi:hypothetical protein
VERDGAGVRPQGPAATEAERLRRRLRR